MLTIGEKIRHFRDLKGYSQEYMAQKLNISTKTYNSLETEKTKVSLEKVQKIATILGINYLELLSYGEKITQINTGDIEGNNNQVNVLNTNKDLTHEIEKLHLQLSHKDEKIVDLTSKISDLEKINTLLTQQNK